MSRFQRSVSGFLLLAAMAACVGLPTPAAPREYLPTIVLTVLEATATPTAAAPLTAGIPTEANPTQPPPTQEGILVSSSGASFMIPQGLATNATSELVAAVDAQGGVPWGVAPAYTRFTLEGYPLQGKFFKPQIMIYAAQEYTAASNSAAISVQRLQSILSNPTQELGNDILPRLPFANAEQIIGVLPQVIAFKNGSGVRVLAEYAQYFAPINNYELFYHFEGLTNDGQSYVVATLPINSTYLAEESDPVSTVPSGGVPFPGYENVDEGIFLGYFQAVKVLLESNAADTFQPTLTSLDALIGSLEISP